MPYITQKDREKPFSTDTVGELNYWIGQICNMYATQHGKSYRTENDIIGALEAHKLERYRRVVAPYEDKKCNENGDVFEI